MKNYVIDTNVLIQAPNALWAFQENRIVIPLVVVEELDHLKKAEGEKGANARKVIRCLEQLRHQGRSSERGQNRTGRNSSDRKKLCICGTAGGTSG